MRRDVKTLLRIAKQQTFRGRYRDALATRIDAYRLLMQGRRYGLALRVLNGADAWHAAFSEGR